MAGERLTVFLLTYNHAKYIRKAFDSILAQETNFSFKIIVLDDASTDGTSDIVREYAGKYPDKITPVIREKNMGVVENMYGGLCKVDTEYFATLEGDDYWRDNHKIQRQIELLDADPSCDICGHDAWIKRFDEVDAKRLHQYDTTGKSDIIVFEGRTMPKVHPSTRIYRHVYDFSKVSPHSAVVWDSSSFWFYCLQNPKFIFINQPMAVYNFTGEGVYSGLDRNKRKLMTLRGIMEFDEALGYKYDDFNRERFRRELYKRHRLLFYAVYFFMKRRAYDWFINRYTGYNQA